LFTTCGQSRGNHRASGRSDLFSAQKKRLFCAPENPIIFFAITQEEIRQTTGFAYLFGEYYPFPRQNIFFSDLSF